VLGVDGCEQGNDSGAMLPLTPASAAFTAEAAAWFTVQPSGDGRCRPLVILQRSTKASVELNSALHGLA